MSAKRLKRKPTKSRYSIQERRAYWFGAGVNAGSTHDNHKHLAFDCSDTKIRLAFIQGYNTNNHGNSLTKKITNSSTR